MLDLSFRVKLQEVKASQLTSKYRTPSALPFFRLDFDGKIVQSPLCEAVGDPDWTGKHKSSFEYRLQEPDLEAAIASLSQRSATMALYFVERSGAEECLVGSCTVDLFTVCTGAVSHSFSLHSPESGKVSTGKVNFMMSMEQQSVVGVSFSNLTFSGLPRPTTASLRYNFISDDTHVQQSGVSVASVDPTWSSVPKILVRTTLRGIMDNTLRIFICDVAEGQIPMAHVDIPLGETLQSNCDHSVKVTRNAYAETTYHKNFTALVQGTLNFTDVPVFGQFASGSNTNGSVYGRPLLDSCPLPPRYTKMSSGGIAAAAGTATVKMPAHHAPDPHPTVLSPSILGEGRGGEAPPPIASGLLPTPRDNYTVQGGSQPTPGFHHSRVSGAGIPIQDHGGHHSSNDPNISAAVSHHNQSSSQLLLQEERQQQQQQQYHNASAMEATAADSFHATRQALGIESRAVSPSKRPASPSMAASQRQIPPDQRQQQSHHYDTSAQGMSTMVQPRGNPSYTGGDASGLNVSIGGGPTIRPTIPVSPMGPIAEQLHRQHEEAQVHILRQQQHVTAMKEELMDRTEREERGSSAMLETLTREEQQARDEMHLVERNIKELDLADQQGQVEHTMSLKQFRATKTQLEMEMQELLEVEAQLLALQKTVAVHADEQARAQERSRLEADDALQKTSKDAALFTELDNRVQNPIRRAVAPATHRAVSPRRAASPQQRSIVMSQSAVRNTTAASAQAFATGNTTTTSSYTQAKLDGAKNLDQHIQQQQQEIYNSPSYQLRSRSPPHTIDTPAGPSSFGGMTAAVGNSTTFVASRNNNSNITSQTHPTSVQPNTAVFVENLRMAIKAGSSAEFSATMRDYPPAIFQDHQLLHLALNAKDSLTQLPNTSLEIVTMILSERSELLHTVHPVTGNTPLHSACANVKTNCGLPIVELLVSRGAKAYGGNGASFNKAGLSPYHVALLNESDEGKMIRRYLLFKGGVDVNQPTATGETPAHLVAVSDRHLAAAQFLKDHGATMDSLAQCSDGNNRQQLMTPAQKAAMYGDAARGVRELLEV